MRPPTSFLEATEVGRRARTSVTQDDPCIYRRGRSSPSDLQGHDESGVVAVFDDMVITYDPDLIDFDLDPFGYVIDGSDSEDDGHRRRGHQLRLLGRSGWSWPGLLSRRAASCRQSEFAVFARVYVSGTRPRRPMPGPAILGGFRAVRTPTARARSRRAIPRINENDDWIEASFDWKIDGLDLHRRVHGEREQWHPAAERPRRRMASSCRNGDSVTCGSTARSETLCVTQRRHALRSLHRAPRATASSCPGRQSLKVDGSARARSSSALACGGPPDARRSFAAYAFGEAITLQA